MNRIGLSGAHRTGKTTLARAVEKGLGLRFIETSTSAVFRRMGLNPAITYDFDTRLTVQREVLKDAVALYQCAGDSFITDRTPLDMLAYTLADAIGDRVPADAWDQFDEYAFDCFNETNKYFNWLVVIQPGIPVIDAPGKAATNRPYIEHLNSLIAGLVADERMSDPVVRQIMPRHTQSLTQRVAWIGSQPTWGQRAPIARTAFELI